MRRQILLFLNLAKQLDQALDKQFELSRQDWPFLLDEDEIIPSEQIEILKKENTALVSVLIEKINSLE